MIAERNFEEDITHKRYTANEVVRSMINADLLTTAKKLRKYQRRKMNFASSLRALTDGKPL